MVLMHAQLILHLVTDRSAGRFVYDKVLLSSAHVAIRPATTRFVSRSDACVVSGWGSSICRTRSPSNYGVFAQSRLASE